MMHTGFNLIAVIAGVWVILVTLLQLVMVLSAMVELRRIRQRDRHQIWRRVLSSPLAPKVSILVPAYNEEITVTETVNGLLALSYPNLEVVVINDGSPDTTAEVLIANFDLRPIHPIYQKVVATADVKSIYRSSREPRLVLVDKFNGGKADSLNAGVNIASGSLVCAIDADTLVAPDALQQLVAPFVTRDDTVAVGGTVRLTNDSPVRGARVTNLVVPRKPLPALQAVEYVRAFIVGRLGWNPLGGNLIISGAFGVFDRAAVLEAGGYEKSSIGEDGLPLVPQVQLSAEARWVRHRRAAGVPATHDHLATVGHPPLLDGSYRMGPAGTQGLHHLLSGLDGHGRDAIVIRRMQSSVAGRSRQSKRASASRRQSSIGSFDASSTRAWMHTWSAPASRCSLIRATMESMSPHNTMASTRRSLTDEMSTSVKPSRNRLLV
jgi:glycosyltransferase involved in cell wall biosynthesis